MDTPITVSSTSTVPNKSDFVQLNYSPGNNEESIISLGSTSFERVPVSWPSKNNTFKRRDSNTTLTNIQKVSNWIRSIEEPKHDSFIVDLEDDVKDDSFKECSTPENSNANIGSESKSIILFRCDFNKSAKACCPTLKSFNHSSLINNIKNEKVETVNSCSTNISSKSEPTGKKQSPSSSNKRMLLKRSESSKLMNHCNKHIKISIDKEDLEMNDTKSNGSSDIYEVPLSPDSQKKELCSYLQLMNPADKKERFILQNRRSTRVRNLTAMQEKKKKDDQITDTGNSEQVTKNIEKCPTLKSFKELNIRVEKVKFSDELFKDKVSETEVDIFYFPFPSKELTESVQDFDNTMSKLISRYKKICRIKNLKLNCKIGLTKNIPKTKENLVKSVHKIKHKVDHKDNNVKQKEKDRKLKDLLRKRYKKPITAARINSLRSTGKFKNVSLKKLIGKKEKELLNRKNLRKSVREQNGIKKRSPQPRKKSTESSEVNSRTEPPNPQCEIVTVPKSSEDSYIDIENLMDNMIDFNNLSEEHKKFLIENRILSTKQSPRQTVTCSTEEEASKSFYSLQEISPLYGFNKADINEVRKICEVYKKSVLNHDKVEVIEDPLSGTDEEKEEENEIRDNVEYKTNTKSAIEKLPSSLTNGSLEFLDVHNEIDIKNNEDDMSISSKNQLTNGIALREHNYAGLPSDDEVDEEKEIDIITPSKNKLIRNCAEINIHLLEKKNKFELLPYNKSVEMKSLHRSLQYIKRKSNNSLTDQSFTREWDSDNSSKQKSKKQSHYISINKENGAVLKAFYIDFNLIVCQENLVSFWMQTPLGNVLGSQNMWIPRGQTQRLVLNGKCLQKESMEMVIAMETHVAYIELWTKEHKSDIREGPVADVFATIYFWKQRQSGLEKKVLQLENINGFADDVQYSVMKSIPKVIVSWHSAHDDGAAAKRTFIHAYALAADYQTVANIYNIEPVDHYVSSLHNIEDCDSLIMGCGENKITLWNVEYGYIIATIVLSEIKSPLSTLWVKCDRGFLFALQQCVDRELRLIAINGINHSWKKLASYLPPEGFDRLRGVCIENGLLLSFYDQGILCWKAETGEPIEEITIESDIIPSGKYVILIEDEQILVKHAMTHLMSLSVDET